MGIENEVRDPTWNRLVHPTLRQTREELSEKLKIGEQLQITDPAVLRPGDILEMFIGNEEMSNILHLIEINPQTQTIKYQILSFIGFSTRSVLFKDPFEGCEILESDLLWLGILPKNPWADKNDAEFNPFASCLINKMTNGGSERA